MMTELKIERFTSPPVLEHAYLVWDDQTRQAVLFDPGGQEKAIDACIKQNKLKLEKIVNTHGHIDHIARVPYFAEKYKVPFYMHQADEVMAEAAPRIAEMFQIEGVEAPKVDEYLHEGDSFDVGGYRFEVIETPGHTPGGCCFYCSQAKAVFVGDTLFRRSIGRVDLPGGDFQLIKQSIVEKLYNLPDETVVYAGHSEQTTIGFEKKNNPFFQGANKG